MNKITKKLFRYFTMLLVFFSVTAFIGFLFVFRYFNDEYLENELKARAAAIGERLEQFLDIPESDYGYGQGHGHRAYLRFVNDIAMADVYILREDGSQFTYGKHGTAGNVPTGDVREFAGRIFSSGSYEHIRRKNENGCKTFYIGVPVLENGHVSAAVIIRDVADKDEDGFVYAIFILGFCLLLTLILSGVISVFLSNRFLRPIHQIADTMKELVQGNYLVTTNVHDKTELGELAEETDLLARKLEAARQKSSKLEQMQKNYITNISHELRTPVTVIRSSLEAVCDGVVTGEKAALYQKQMLAECISLQRLVNDMLELSRLQNNDFPIEKENMNLTMALEDAIHAVRVIARDKSIKLSYEKDVAEYLLDGDYGRLRQMFMAALDNAIKYSSEGGEVFVTAKDEPDCFCVSIQDHGCGILPEDMEHIFNRFYRSPNNKAKGSGLGLAIIKSIAERHDIDVCLQSTPGEGTEIRFLIKK